VAPAWPGSPVTGTTVVRVRVPVGAARGYEVRIGPGLLEELGTACAEAAPAHRYAVLSDARVASLYGERALASLREAGLLAELHVFPPGEGSKTRATWTSLTDELLAAGHGRDSVVVALGGGVTGDLAGFVAATFERGLPVVQVPTSLLAMVDSAVGGKTAVDTQAGKNLVGAFHHPALVVVDTSVLATLGRPHRAGALAEAVKMGAVADADLLHWIGDRSGRLLEGEPESSAELVRRCVGLKARIVGEDPRETGRRAVLNFGHTVGHALERLSGWTLTHGGAVAAGARTEARLGEALGTTRSGTAAALSELLDRCGHRDRPERQWTAGEVLEAAAGDKKGRKGRLRVVMLEVPGRVARAPDGAWTWPLDEAGLASALGSALRGASETADSGARTLREPGPPPTRGSATGT